MSTTLENTVKTVIKSMRHKDIPDDISQTVLDMAISDSQNLAHLCEQKRKEVCEMFYPQLLECMKICAELGKDGLILSFKIPRWFADYVKKCGYDVKYTDHSPKRSYKKLIITWGKYDYYISRP